MSRIESLIARMTLSEKLGQLTMTACGMAVTGPTIAGDSTEAIKSGAIGNLLNLIGASQVHAMQRLAVEQSRLRIPLLIGLDVVHGHRTLFPIPLAEAAVFDPETWQLSASEAAREAAADGIAMTFAPMLDVARDPRWGRSAEGPGEDPWLGARIAAAKVRGFQGEDLSRDSALAAVAKHFCAYGAVTAGREYASVDVSQRTLHEVHLPPFAAAVAAGVVAVMPAFTDLAGIPMTANKALLRGWLRGHCGFDGVLVSDYNAIAELIHHGVAADLAQAATLALQAGIDIDMMADAYRRGLPLALERGDVAMADIDESVRRVLTLKERLGLFENPFGRGRRPESARALARRRKLARAIGSRSLVLLKNARDALPIAGAVREMAVLGPLANAPAEMRGPWVGAAPPNGHVSVLEGLRAAWPRAKVSCAAGVAISEGVAGTEGSAAASDAQAAERGAMNAALELCATADAIVLCLGESAAMSGEASSRAHLGLPGRQRELALAVCERASARHVPLIAVVFSGRPLVIPWLIERADAVLAAWFPGSEAGNAIADVLIGRISPSGRTPVTWPRASGQVPIFFSERAGGRPFERADRFTSKYLDVVNEPLFPFGFGLTYGRFELSNLRLSSVSLGPTETLFVWVDVCNRGTRQAQETVFLFTHDKFASVARPVLELKGFGKITLAPAASGTVKIDLHGSQLFFLGEDLEPVFEPGKLEILVGPCADRRQLLASSIDLIAARPCGP